MPSTATYLYCLVHSATAPRLARVPAGLPGAGRPSVVPIARSLRAVVADVPLEIYGSPALEAALVDLQWVGEVALAHESVVEYVARAKGATVIPMKLFTMFSSLDRAIRDVKQREPSIAAAVKRVRGCAEWGVRVARAAGVAARPAAADRANSGAAFLAAKKQARDDARAALAAGAEAAGDAFDLLASAARAATRRDSEPQGAPAPPLLDAAFLVTAGSLPRFKAAARRAAAACASAGVELTLTGPWPPYNFVQLEERA